MNFQFMSRQSTNVQPANPKKRPHDDPAPASSTSPPPRPPTFGMNQAFRFLFQTRSPTPDEHERTVAIGALGRVYKARDLPAWNKSWFAFPAPQSDTPSILLRYLRFFFTLVLALVFLYLVLAFIWTVRRDIEQRISEYSMDIVQHISVCAMQYKNNLCATNPIPAMMHQCATWETCMNRDPTIVGRAKVAAAMIAEVANDFVEPISWKTLVFALILLSFLMLIWMLWSRHQPSYPIPPSTLPPQAHFGRYFPALTPIRVWPPRAGLDNEQPQRPNRRRRLD